jgi:histidine ammonia-lyase
MGRPKIHEVVLDGHSLTIDQVILVARGDGHDNYPNVSLSEKAHARIKARRDALEPLIDTRVMYGINTGCGSNRHRIIPRKDLDGYQRKYIMTHAIGVGPNLPKEQVRAMMLLRVNSFAVGNSAVTIELCERILWLLNRDIIPVIPAYGSVGASGDLIPLAHLGAVLIGLPSDVIYLGHIEPISRVYSVHKMEALTLHAKEAMGLTNGATLILAQAILGLSDATELLDIANLNTALGLEAIRGEYDAFDERIHLARNQQGQIQVAKDIRALILDSRRISQEAQKICFCGEKAEKPCKACGKIRVQDAYSTRCAPQAHGAFWDTLDSLRQIILREINASTDNPLIFEKDEGFDVLSGGNFHGDSLAIPLEATGIAMAKLASISNSRLFRLLSKYFNSGLPQDLSGDNDDEHTDNTGFMIVQYLVASRVNRAAQLANPAATINVPTAEMQEDYVSMGSNSALKFLEILENVEYVLAMELLLSCQAISLAEKNLPENLRQLGIGTGKAFSLVRENIPCVKEDIQLKPLVDKAVELVRSRRVLHVLE